ncbi:NAD-dependent protein deacetylase [Micromonospora sp. LOL_024]|uniref:NAD-dependent protein deacetylase n=1 Tax=Micromonospora sp. LOL_024 TaxID=3345412 RepID=UPI003A8566B6
MDEVIEPVAGLVAGGGVVVLSGAGLSTDSGIPDYRGPSGVARRHTPMTYQTFVGDAAARRRYWARSHLGWQLIAGAAPNDGHRAVARLQLGGLVSGVITQNVDGLHTAAGSRDVLELHGRLDQVVCLGCGQGTARLDLDRRLRRVNPQFVAAAGATNPDGDVDLDDVQVAGFRTVDCLGCGGVLKPDVVFFGETVPAVRVQRCFAMVEQARLLLVLGSSLTVMSGRRFVVRAVRHGVPVVIVNQGPTRGDVHAALRVDAPLGRLLPVLAGRLLGDGSPAGAAATTGPVASAAVGR